MRKSMRKWRVVSDKYGGYEAQFWSIWWPFWSQRRINTHRTLEAAEEYAMLRVRGTKSGKAIYSKGTA